jgi:2-polyprenyl-3-methyl-5-hydroxy-6-metoxy-1,4-benzoquinol methylase
MKREMLFRNKEPVRSEVILVVVPLQSHPNFSDIISCYVTDVHTRLLSSPPARIADIGCGSGQSAIDMALAYPKVRVDGYDIDDTAIDTAWATARRAGVTDRVTFHVRDVTDESLNGRYDFLILFIAIHGMANPVGVLKTMRRLVTRDGIVIILTNLSEVEGMNRYALEAGFDHVEVIPADGVVH